MSGTYISRGHWTKLHNIKTQQIAVNLANLSLMYFNKLPLSIPLAQDVFPALSKPITRTVIFLENFQAGLFN